MSHLHDSAASDKTKRSWLPVVLAIVLPIIGIAIAYGILIVRSQNETPPEPMGQQPAVSGPAYITVKVEDSGGDVLQDREVRFAHQADSDSGDEEFYTKKTDSAGMVTLTLPRTGNVTITVEGAEAPKRLKALEQNASEFYELTIVVEEENAVSP